MSKNFNIGLMFLTVFTILLIIPLQSTAYEKAPQKPAIVLAAFGTTEVEGLGAIFNVEKRVKAAFPGYDVHLAFTSNIIREIWHKRGADETFRKENKLPDALYNISNPLTTLAKIQENGARAILVQSLHITNGTEFADLKNLITQLAKIDTFQNSKKPFPYLVLGNSALGTATGSQLDRAARALAPLIAEAKTAHSALVLMGHGNEHLEIKSYLAFEKILNKMYDVPVFVGLVEGRPGLEEVQAGLKKKGVKNIVLAPLMLVAGDHAKNDMAGAEKDSWLSVLSASGYGVKPHIKGLGLTNAWADIYVERLRELEAEYNKIK